MVSSSGEISVVLPVFNGERYIEQSLISIKRQSFTDFECIIINDGSTDGSLVAIEKIVGSDKRFHIINHENRGIVAALNEGIDLARGEYIFRMDADDIARTERFAKQVRYLKNNPDCVALGSQMLVIDPDGAPISANMITAFDHDAIDLKNMTVGLGICHPAVAMRRKALLDIGGYRRAYEWAEDLDLFLRLAEHGRLANLADVLLEYRQHVTSVGYARQELQSERARAAVADARLRRRLSPATEIAKITRPLRARQPVEDHHKWAWWALLGGHPATARKHAWKCMKLGPLDPKNWRLAACALRGH